MQMDVIEYLKTEQPMDSIIISMLFFGMSVSAVAKRCGVSRQHIYNVVGRSKTLLLKYELLDITE